MKLEHKGMRIELDDDDVRVAVIEALLFGRTLPAPLPVDLPEPAPERPKVRVPPAVLRCWEVLKPVERAELALLAEGPRRPEEVEKALGVTQRMLMGCHSRINRYASQYGVRLYVESKGRGRDGKRYYVASAAVPWIKALAGLEASATRHGVG